MKWQEKAKSRMKELGIIQEDLKEVLGVGTRGAVGHYFNERRRLKPIQMAGLCLILKFNSLDELFGDNQLFIDNPRSVQQLDPEIIKLAFEKMVIIKPEDSGRLGDDLVGAFIAFYQSQITQKAAVARVSRSRAVETTK